MLTLFTCPKPFTDPHIRVIQRNAITSWTRLEPRPEILLFGNEVGVGSICQELGLRHISDVSRNEFGTPLLNDVFEKAQRATSFDLLAYVNADIILMSDFLDAVRKVRQALAHFLIFGQRWDIDLNKPWNFESAGWERRLREYAIRSRPKGSLWGLSDYFVFPRGTWQEIPPFAVGRTAFDNWLIYAGRKLRIPVIDATQTVMVIHQKHDYLHQSHRPRGWGDVAKGVEALRNRTLADGGDFNEFGLFDATHILTSQGLKRAFGIKYWFRSLDSLPILHPCFASLRTLKPIRKVLSSGIRRVVGFGMRER